MTQADPKQRMQEIKNRLLVTGAQPYDHKELIVSDLDLSIPDVPLGNRFGIIGKWLVKIRKKGFHFFARWYVVPAFRRQEANNYRLADSMAAMFTEVYDRLESLEKDSSVRMEELHAEIRDVRKDADVRLGDLHSEILEIGEGMERVISQKIENTADQTTANLIKTTEEMGNTLRHLGDRVNESDLALKSGLDRAQEDFSRAIEEKGALFDRVNTDLLNISEKIKKLASQWSLLQAIFASDEFAQGQRWTKSEMSGVLSEFVSPVEDIARGFEQYLPYLLPAEKILDVGSGTGPLFFLLAEHGCQHKLVGVDINPVAVAACHGNGYMVNCSDIFDFLEKYEGDYFDVVFCAHILEHLTNADKIGFLKAIKGVMKPGARLIVETPNTMSTYVLTHLYFLDSTHQQPLHPEAYRMVIENSGFKTLFSGLTMPINASGFSSQDSENHYNYSWIGQML